MNAWSVDFRSEQRIEMLKQRVKRCVCKYCGGQLRLRRITFGSFDEARIEIFCGDCDRIEFGVEPEIYANARFFMEETGFSCYADLDDSTKVKQMSLARICEIMTWQNQNIGILNLYGFTIPLQIKEYFAGECVTFSELELDGEEE